MWSSSTCTCSGFAARKASRAFLALSGNRSPVRLQSEGLQQRLAQNLCTNRLGSTMYSTTLKEHVTPAQRTFVRQSVSALRTSGSDFISLLAGWPTPTAATAEKNVRSMEGSDREIARKNGPQDMAQAANLAGWPTPNGPVRLTATGQVLTGSSAGMESGGQLNPALSAWFMGLPPEWDQAAIRASRNVATRKKRGK